VLAVLPTHRRAALGKPAFCALFLALSTLVTQPARGESCPTVAGCFDANSLWLPTGRTEFVSLPGTRVNGVGKVNFGFAAELLRSPVLLHVASPDSGGRDVHVVDYALDASLWFAVGAFKNLEASFALPARLYQSGAGADGVTSQSAPPVEQAALRDPRLGAAYSLDDALAKPGLGLRVALDVSLPVGSDSAFAGEHSAVAMPSATFGWQISRVALRASLGARLRSAVDFGDVRLGSQGFVALGAGVDLVAPGLLFLSVESFALPPLVSSRAAAASAEVTGVSLLPAEWLLSVHSSFRRDSDWSLSGSFGTGLPLSSETRLTAGSSSTAHFLGLTEPEWRAVLALRFEPQ
jgi:hypothetical protein